ncbi:hypothetical protein D9M71_815510 [compost metagenome]
MVRQVGEVGRRQGEVPALHLGNLGAERFQGAEGALIACVGELGQVGGGQRLVAERDKERVVAHDGMPPEALGHAAVGVGHQALVDDRLAQIAEVDAFGGRAPGQLALLRFLVALR